MTIQKLASELAKREGKKSQARIGDIRELLKHLVEMQAEHYEKGGAFDGSTLAAIDDRAWAKSIKLIAKAKRAKGKG